MPYTYLGVDRRSVIRYILAGIAGPQGQRIKLPAHLLKTRHGQEYQVRRSDIEEFVKFRSLSVQERRPGQKVSSGAQLVAGELELERQHLDLQLALSVIKEQAREIEHLAIEKGELAGENTMLRQRLAQMEQRQEQGVVHRFFAFLIGRRHKHLPWE